MTWKRLIPTTLVVSVLAAGAATLAFPKPATGQGGCGSEGDVDCEPKCLEKIKVGGQPVCNEWFYSYRFKEEG